jgi:hypothetical protein
MSRRLLVIRGAGFSRSRLVSRRVKPGNRVAGLILASLGPLAPKRIGTHAGVAATRTSR